MIFIYLSTTVAVDTNGDGVCKGRERPVAQTQVKRRPAIPTDRSSSTTASATSGSTTFPARPRRPPPQPRASSCTATLRITATFPSTTARRRGGSWRRCMLPSCRRRRATSTPSRRIARSVRSVRHTVVAESSALPVQEFRCGQGDGWVCQPSPELPGLSDRQAFHCLLCVAGDAQWTAEEALLNFDM